MKFLFLACCLLFIVSCERVGTVDVGSDQALKARVDSRWSDLRGGRLKAVYQYYSPEYRRLHSFESFTSSIGASVEWISVVVDSVDIKENRGFVNTTIRYRLKLPGMIGEQLGSQVGDIEKKGEENWVWRSKQWWYADKTTQGLK